MTSTLPDRRLIVLTGPGARCNQAVQQLIVQSHLHDKQILWLKPRETAQGYLGQERAMAIIDARAGLNPDVFGRVSGLIQAGGALVLLCPEFDLWPSFQDPEYHKLLPYPQDQNAIKGHYLKRWVRLLSNLHGVEIVRPEGITSIPPIVPVKIDHPLSLACTPDQQHAMDAIFKTVSSQRRRPAILRADRGRGKSAALGLAAGQMLLGGELETIFVTAGSFKQLASVFKHAHALQPGDALNLAAKSLRLAQGTLRYIPVDTLIRDLPDCELLIIDEASTLSVAQLEALLKHYSRIAFSGTEHGYEGSGRGFTLKFRQLLERYSRGRHEVHLAMPVRWAENDSLERWTNQLLLLDAQVSAAVTTQKFQLQSLRFSEIKPLQLVENEALLRQLFGLLVDAHYQTRPVDCRYLLDAPNSRLFAAWQGERAIGLVWIMHEGELSADMARDIVAGHRRPQGHLVPQILAAHLGLEQAAMLACARIQRIVVSPLLQDQGIGSWMLEQLEQLLALSVDYLASSFGADRPLSRFWRAAGFEPVRMGDTCRAASGLHSMVVIKPCSNPAVALIEQAKALYTEQFIAQLADSLHELDPQLAAAVAPRAGYSPGLNAGELKAAVLFAYAGRPYESSLVVLQKIAHYALLSQHPGLQDTHLRILIMRCLQHQPWSSVARRAGLQGQSECLKILREGVKTILADIASKAEISAMREQYAIQA